MDDELALKGEIDWETYEYADHVADVERLRAGGYPARLRTPWEFAQRRKELLAEAQEAEIRRLQLLELQARVQPPAQETQSTGHSDNHRYGKEYDGRSVEEVVRRATAAQMQGRRLGRTLRNDLAGSVRISTYAVGKIFRLMKQGRLADAGREGWLKVAGQASATPAFVNLHELELRS